MIANLLHSRKLFGAAGAVLALSCVAMYAAGLGGPFLMDDFDAIFPLVAIHAELGSLWDALVNAPYHIRVRWVSNLSFLATQLAAGSPIPPQAFAFKLGNLIVHLATGAAAYLLARRLLGRWSTDDTRARWLGLLVAALFLAHPLLVSTVLYPVQRMAQLATLFTLLAAWAYMGWRMSLDSASSLASGLRLTGVCLLIALAVFSKENGALAPLLIGVVELFAFSLPAKDSPQRSRFEAGFGLVCVAPIMLGLVLFGLRWKPLLAGYEGRDFTLAERLLTQVHVIVDYFGQIVWPRIGSMGLYRDDFPLTKSIDAPTIAWVAILLAAAIGAVSLRRRWPAPSFGVAWFLAAHVLESSVLPLELVFEHRNYLALFGPALAIAWLVGRMPAPLALSFSVVVAFGLGVQTYRRVADWADYGRWIRAELANHPLSLRANTDLIVYLSNAADPAEAVAALEAMRTRFPQSAQPAIVALWLRCRTEPLIDLGIADRDILALRRGRVGKDAFHTYSGLHRNKLSGRCEGVSWPQLAQVADAVARNPEVVAYPRAAAAWQRLSAEAHAESDDWRAVLASTERALAIEANDPADWVRLMEARVHLGDAAGYAQARNALLQLTNGNLGHLAARVSALDEAVRRGTAAAPEARP